MKIILWGSTGLTGREVLSQALEDGHEVKAVVRKPEQIKVEHANLTVVRGNALNPKSVQEAVAGGEVVIQCVGNRFHSRAGTQADNCLLRRLRQHCCSHAQIRHPPLYCTRSGRNGARSKRADHQISRIKHSCFICFEIGSIF